ncbi:putative vacuolar iron transporter protein [Cladorrhinum sp. PSN259]|nr:putative vacuolar iron transporter protein [Cladorrhinum sp. PSN259]
MPQPSYSTMPTPGPDHDRTPLLKHVSNKRAASPSPSPSSLSRKSSNSNSSLTIPSATRFLADFTLGFADGLTVPFALTAGLSSLGETDTVIYAGMAEICAGSISMGIGGYLSAKGEYTISLQEEQPEVVSDEETVIAGVEEEEEGEGSVVERYLAPLGLEKDEEMRKVLVGWVKGRPEVVKRIMERDQQAKIDKDAESAQEGGTRAAPSPFLVGLSVSLGYLLGGLLPLFPYFFVGNVGDGLKWSFAVCLVALFGFGFLKDFFLNRKQQQGAEDLWSKGSVAGRNRVSWRDVRRSMWEGIQMAMMGGVAAVAAVLCVKAFEGLGV